MATSRRYDNELPKHPEFDNLSARIHTFRAKGYWIKNKSQTPEDMAKAGFFYAGTSDCTRCFHCGGGMRNWLSGDDPFVEHSRWFSDCLYIRNLKGAHFVDNVNENYPRDDNVVSTNKQKFYRIVEDVKNENCGKAMNILGFENSLIEEAIVKALNENGWDKDKVTTEMLATIAYDIKDEEITRQGENHEDDPIKVIDPFLKKKVDTLVQDTASTTLTEKEKTNQVICKICMVNQAKATFLPCGHLVTCSVCYSSINKCPICRQKIISCVWTYIS